MNATVPQVLAVKVPAAAAQLPVSETTVWMMIRRGDLPVFKIGRSTRIPSSALEEFVRNRAGVQE